MRTKYAHPNIELITSEITITAWNDDREETYTVEVGHEIDWDDPTTTETYICEAIHAACTTPHIDLDWCDDWDIQIQDINI